MVLICKQRNRTEQLNKNISHEKILFLSGIGADWNSNKSAAYRF
jgi:hypothetical protein